MTNISVRCLGVADWAWRKGKTYGTILVNLARSIWNGVVAELRFDRRSGQLLEDRGPPAGRPGR